MRLSLEAEFVDSYPVLFSQPILADSKGQGDLECCSAWGHKESDMNERLSLSLEGTKVVTEGLEGLELCRLLKVNKE